MNEFQEKYLAFLIDTEMKMKFEHACVGINEPSGKIASLIIETIVVNRDGKMTKKEENKNAKLV